MSPPASLSSSASYRSSFSSEDLGPEDPDDPDDAFAAAAAGAAALASTETLLNEPLPLRLTFSRNNVTHATLHAGAAAGGGALYRINQVSKTRVELVDLTIMEGRAKVVATLKRRELLPDVVVFAHREGKAMRVRKWLQQPTPPDGRTILRTLHGHYIWRSDDATHRLALYPEEDQTHSPIAYYQKIENPPTLALVLRAGFEHIRVEIITSFIVLEYRLRVGEKVKEGEKKFGSTVNGVVFVVGY